MVRVRVGASVGSAALAVCLLASLAAGIVHSASPEAGARGLVGHAATASVSSTTSDATPARFANRLDNGLRGQSQNHPLPSAGLVAVALLVAGLLLLASVPPGRDVRPARSRRFTPPRAPPLAA